jgi:predicted ATP-dependent serine protease
MENDEWICCNCGVVTLDRNGRCPTCRADNVAPFLSSRRSSSPHIDRAEEAKDRRRVISHTRMSSQPERARKAG